MSKKHFVVFAAEIKTMREDAAVLRANGNVEGADNLEREAAACSNLVCRVSRQFNPNFDADRFETACNL